MLHQLSRGIFHQLNLSLVEDGLVYVSRYLNLGYPSSKGNLTLYQDSPLGVRLADFVTAFPTGINTAATCVHNDATSLG